MWKKIEFLLFLKSFSLYQFYQIRKKIIFLSQKTAVLYAHNIHIHANTSRNKGKWASTGLKRV